MPPHVPVPKKGPCPGVKRAVKKAAVAVKKAAAPAKTRAKKTATPAKLTPQQAAERASKVEKVIEAARRADISGIKAPKVTGDEWQDRAAALRELAADMYRTYAGVPADRKAVFSGGMTGSGKTTALKRVADPSQYVMINADDAKEEMAKRGWIPDVPGAEGLTPMELSTLVHEDSIQVADLIADMAVRDGKNLVWDATMNDPQVAEGRIKWLRSSGYQDVRGVLVQVPAKVSKERARQRWLDGVHAAQAGEGAGGRYVPEWVLGYQNPAAIKSTFDRVKKQLDGWTEFGSETASTPLKQTGEGGKPWR